MKQRIITAGIGVIILFMVLFFYKTIVLNIAVALISAMSVYELLFATKYIKNKLLDLVCLLFSILIPFFRPLYFYEVVIPIFSIFIFILVVIMLFGYKIIKIEQIGFGFFISVMIPFALSTVIYVREKFSDFPYISLFYILMSLGSAWISDSGAYFVGTFFGKTLLAPKISPKKTVEGLFGGIFSSVLFSLILSLIFSLFFANLPLHIYYWRALLVTPIASLVGVVGDLFASLIKRQCMIKDFGNIMPGHGGVLDRFDSVLFTVPFYYLIVLFFPLIKF